MEEKKLTDEEFIHDLEEFERDIDMNETGIYTKILNLIHRLQSENERLNDMKFTQEHCDLYKENELLKSALKKELSEHEEFTKKAKDEIERLTEERDMYADDLYWKAEVRKREDFITELTVEKAELQKQVDELMKRNFELAEKGEKVCVAYKRAVKDKAKEILIEFNEWINGQYDAKLDTYSVHIPIHEVNDFLTDKAKEFDVEVERWNTKD